MNTALKVEVSKDHITITVPIERPIKASKTGKSLTVATTHGNMVTDAMVNGKPLFVGVNAYIKQ